MGTVIPNRPEPIQFERTEEVSDGANGTMPGDPNIAYSCLAEWGILKPSRKLEAAQESLRQAYWFKFWVNPDFEPRVSDTIIFRDERLTNQGFAYDQIDRRKYYLTALEQVNGVGGG